MARKPAFVSISKLAASHREDAKMARERAKNTLAAREWLGSAEHDANVVCKVADLVAECHYTNTTVWTYGQPENTELTVTFDVPVDSLKEGAIVAVLEAAMAQGFETQESKDYVNQWATQRMFRFSKVYDNGTRCLLRITADIKDGSETCRKVQTGTKLEEVATYAIVCD
jgi:hypothetical protein